jgi:hypothetical protein
MTVTQAKVSAQTAMMWVRHTIIVLLVIEFFIAHTLAFLYVTNFRIELIPVTKVLSPIK